MCPEHGAFVQEDGIWRFLLPERALHFARFIEEYATVREAEGRGDDDAAYYRALPFTDLSGRHTYAWTIRAAGYRAFLKSCLQPLEQRHGRPLDLLDLGAGNGWLSYRTAQRDHRAVAVDLQVNRKDGLGAHVHYDASFACVQAAFHRLPFSAAQFDLVVFNAALHYADDYAAVLHEALRVLRPNGRLVILDSPLYHDPSSGKTMVKEREGFFLKRFGFRSDAVPSQHFLTFGQLDALAETLGLTYRLVRPRYGLRWRLRPAVAWLLRRREPATFALVLCRRALPKPLDTTLKTSHAPLIVKTTETLLRLKYRLFQRRRLARGSTERIQGLTLEIPPGVFNPIVFRTAAFTIRAIDDALTKPGLRVLDMGTGTGLAALVAARRGSRVDAVDFNPEAAACARRNAQRNGVADRVTVFEGDLFAPVHGKRYDLIFFNPPFFLGTPATARDGALWSENVVARFAAKLRAHLKPAGKAMVLLSTKGATEGFLRSFLDHGFQVEIALRKDLLNETLHALVLNSMDSG